MPVKVISKASVYTKKHGLRSTVKYSLSLLSNRAKPRLSNSKPNYIFISHPINNTGAPLVLMQVIEEFAHKYGPSRVKVIAPNITSNNQSKLKKLGIRISKAAGAFSDKIIRFQLALKPDDFVLINTIAIHENYRIYIFNELKAGRLKQANWFIHEDEAQISLIAPQLLEKRNIEQISKLINTNKLKVFVPSKRTQEEYNKIFMTKKVQTLPLRLDIDSRYSIKRKDNDYSELNFLLSGSPSDGRKGQLIAIAAFNKYLEDYYKKNPKNYRPFTLQLVSIGEDYISKQIKWIGSSLLGESVKFYPSVTYKEALDITAKCNAVICCSLNETFALYVAEGMYMGHVILRNDTSGVDEQLKDGKNGYLIDHTNIGQFAGCIEKLLNKKTNSNKDLLEMGRTSQDIIDPFMHNTYLDKIINKS
jgi:glycosyltransferase involved in cell wall biosynthesis